MKDIKREIDIKLLEKILTSKRVGKLIKKYNLNENQIHDAIPILIDIYEEEKSNHGHKYMTSLISLDDGTIKRVDILSKKGKEIQFIENITTQNVLPINTDITLDNVQKTPERKIVGSKILKFFSEYDDNVKTRGLYIYGEVGIGKTFIAQAIANKLAKNGKKVAFVNLSDLIFYLKSNFNTGVEKFINNIKNVDFLFLDDIGSETISQWFRDDILLSVLSSRMNNNKTTFFTSNYSYDELKNIEAKTQKNKIYDNNKSIRLIERIKALSTPVHLSGKNRRY